MTTVKQLDARVTELEKLVATIQTKLDSISIQQELPDKKDNKKNTNKDGTPKKPKAKTGYLIFSCEKREEIKDILTQEFKEPPKPNQVITKLGAVWKSLSDDEKAVYNDKAKLLAQQSISENDTEIS